MSQFVLPRPAVKSNGFWKFIQAATVMFALMAFVLALGNREPDSVPCAPADAGYAALPVRYQDVRMPDLDRNLVVDYVNHAGVWTRDFFGCSQHETDAKRCIWEAGGGNGPEWAAARELAKKVYVLAEPRKARFQ